MALLNCAYVLAGTGSRVLMIDLDLEAPGLSFLSLRQSEIQAKQSLQIQGVVDLIGSFVEDSSNWALGDENAASRLKEYYLQLPIPEATRVQDTDGSLALLPAGRLDDDYLPRLSAIPWQNGPLCSFRDDLFRHIRNVINHAGQFDYVLIDSRTGWSDEGYLSARILADHLVILSGLNDQNIRGTADFLKQVSQWEDELERPKKKILLVASPVPEWEESAKQQRFKEVLELLKQLLNIEVNFTHNLPYHPLLAFGEYAMVADWPLSNLAKAYWDLTNSILNLAKDDAKKWRDCAFLVINSFDKKQYGINTFFDFKNLINCLKRLKILDANEFKIVAMSSVSVLQKLGTPSREAVDFMRYIMESLYGEIDFSTEYAITLFEWAKTRFDKYLRKLLDISDLDEVQDALQEALIIFEKNKNEKYISSIYEMLAKIKIEYVLIDKEHAEIDSLLFEIDRNFERSFNYSIKKEEKYSKALEIYNVGLLYLDQGNYTEAINKIQRALEIFKSLIDLKSIAMALVALGRCFFEQSNYNKARNYFEQTLEIYEQLDENRAIAASVYYLAQIDVQQGKYSSAQKKLLHSLEVFKDNQDKENFSRSINEMARINLEQGDYISARKRFEDSLKIFKEISDQKEIALIKHNISFIDVIQGKYEEAREGFKDLIEVFKNIEDERELSLTFQRLARMDFELKKYDSALEYSNKSLTCMNNMKDETLLRMTKILLAAIKVAQGGKINLKEERENLDYIKKNATPSQVSRSWQWFAKIHIFLGHTKIALKFVRESHEHATNYGLQGQIAEANFELALMLSQLGRTLEAKKHAQAATQFFDEQDVKHLQRAELDKIAQFPARKKRKTKTSFSK